jgi:hypothetical protein
VNGARAGLLACFLLPLAACGPAREAVLFEDLSAASGLSFAHEAGEGGEYWLPEIMGAGVALLDYDGDGDLDLYLLQGGAVAPAAGTAGGHRLLRSERDARGRLHFTDATAAAGLGDGAGYGMGAATGDLDGDGDADLYVTQYGQNRLYRNEGGRFSDVTAGAGVADAGWSTSASFCDYDRDGDLDLYVAHYVVFAPGANRLCTGTAGRRDYCSPEVYAPQPDRLFRNDGGLRFTDVSEPSGIAARAAAGLGVACADFDGDGWPDFYVANDRMPDFLWRNLGDGRFAEEGAARGAAYDGDGKAEASMGIAGEDFDDDGDVDLFVTTYDPETNTLRRNEGAGTFLDVTDRHALGFPSLSCTGWGTAWLDVDLDGALDLYVANGGVVEVETQRGRSPRPYEQLNQLFRRQPDQRFALEPARGALALLENSRGAAFGDLDDDGDTDIVVTNNDGPARVLANVGRGPAHWLGVQLRSAASNSQALGARVSLLRVGRPAMTRLAHTDGSYLSAGDPRVLFGLGAGARLERIVVAWPSGRRESWPGLAADRYHTLVEGTGTPL